MVKKICEKFLYYSHVLGYICSILIKNSNLYFNNNNLYLFIIPILFSFISIIAYIITHKNETNEKYILIHVVIDFVFLIWMTYFL